VPPVTSTARHPRYRRAMMLFRTIVIWAVQVLLFCVGIGVAGLSAHLFGPIMAETFSVHELIPTALIFFAVAATLGWIGNRFLPEDWTYHDPLL
jgi:hypothetical protein